MIKLKQLITEYNDGIRKLAVTTDSQEIKKIRRDLKKDSNWSDSEIDYMLAKYKKAYPKVTPTSAKPKQKLVKWNKKLYDRWIKDSASGGGWRNSYEMAQNAKLESGLIQYVKQMVRKDGGDETPLERIQWDIENRGK